MNYTEEELVLIEELGGLFFSSKEISIILEIPDDILSSEIKLETGEAYNRYKKGWLTNEIKLRKSILESALNGSNPAQVLMLKINQKNNA